MSQVNTTISPAALLSTPRLGPALPNGSGTLILHTVSHYSFETHSWSNEICLKDVETGENKTIISDGRASEPNWLGVEDLFLYLQSEEESKVKLIILDARDTSKEYVTGDFDGPVSGLKLQGLNDSAIAFLVSGQVDPSGNLHNPSNEVAKVSPGRLYTSLPVRSWDSYVAETRNSIFFGTLHKTDGYYKFSSESLKNILEGHPGLESPIPPFGDSNQYDISRNGVVFLSKNPNTNLASSPASNVYFICSTSLGSNKVTLTQKIFVSSLHGASSSPVFSPDGNSVAFLKMEGAEYESDVRG